MAGQNLERRVRDLAKVLAPLSGELRLALDYVRPDPASSLTKSRLILEKVLVSLYASEMGKEPRKPLLGDMLNDNQFTRKIDRRILSRMSGVRDMGNLGPHGEAVEPSDAARVLDDLCEVLEWYLQRKGADAHVAPATRDGASVGRPAGQKRPVPLPCIIAPAVAFLLVVAVLVTVVSQLPFGTSNSQGEPFDPKRNRNVPATTSNFPPFVTSQLPPFVTSKVPPLMPGKAPPQVPDKRD
jgi:hypothetical protein